MCCVGKTEDMCLNLWLVDDYNYSPECGAAPTFGLLLQCAVAVCVSCASIRHAPRATCQAAWTGALWRPTTTAASLFFLVVLPARLGPLAIVSVVYYGRLWVTCLTARRLSLREPLLYSQTNSEPNAANL